MFAILLFLVAPIIGLPIYIVLYANCENRKKNIVYSLLIGVVLGIIAYYFIPKTGYDLVRHQSVIYRVTNLDFKHFLLFTKNYDLEFIPLLYSYIISFFNNPDLLQFFVVSLGYSLILYILNDYKIHTKINKILFIFISLFTMISFQHLYFISGLYFYIATILFSFTLYLEYVKEKNKKTCIVLYIISLLIHNAMFLPFILVVIHKLLKNKFSLKTLLLLLLLFFGSFLIVNYLNQIFDNTITNSIAKMYGNYTKNESHFKIYYSGFLYYLEICKFVIIILSIMFSNKNKKINGYILTLALMTILMMTKSSVTIRYIMLIQIIGAVPLMDLFKEKMKIQKVFMLFLLFVMILAYSIYYYNLFKNQNFGKLNENYYKNIVSVFNKK